MAMTNAERQKAYRERKKAEGQEDERSRVYATILYPDSAPPNWKEIIVDWHVSTLISPLHDKDINPDGSLKKPHHHIMIMFDGLKSWNQVKPLFNSIKAVGREKVMSTRGYARYLCHLDNPEKAQYKPQDVICYGGADYTLINNLPTDDLKALIDIFDFISMYQVRSLAHLIDYSRKYRTDWLLLVLRSHAYIIDKYIKSLTWEVDTGQARSVITDDNGEVLDV